MAQMEESVGPICGSARERVLPFHLVKSRNRSEPVSRARSREMGAQLIYYFGGAPILRSMLRRPPKLTKGNEPLPTLVPKDKAHALEALKQRKSAHTAKFGIVAEHPRQPVVRNATA